VDQHHQNQNAALVSVGANLALVTAKVLVGLAIGSVSVVSEAMHSGVDLLAALITLLAVRTASKPTDQDHPFGYGKWEDVSGTIQALLIFGTAGVIVYEAVAKLRHPHPVEALGLGVAVMLASALINYFVARLLFRVGRRAESPALEADGWHHLTDVWTSAAVMGGLAVTWLGGRFLPQVNLHWLDPAVAIGVALLITRTAWDMTVHAGRDLLDTHLPQTDRWIREYLGHQPPLVRGYHHLRTRKSGCTRFVEFHLWVDPQMSVENSHRLGDQIVDGIRAEYPNSRVTVHVEPYHVHQMDHSHEGTVVELDGDD
jgi:cation diffusion facilitator family transporter